MPRYKCTVEYDGKNFSGWQRQPNVMTVQQAIEEAITAFTGERVNVYASGRTDAGVHAIGQVCHFDLKKTMTTEKIKGAINFHTRPHAVSVVDIEITEDDFHARFSAKKRYYRYEIINRRSRLILDDNRAWHVPVTLDEHAMQEAANHLIGHHDFSSFRDSLCQARSPCKTIDDIRVTRNKDCITIEIEALSFLHHMVRIITGSLKHVGEHKWPSDHVETILNAKDRTISGPTAPAHGLYFVKIDY